MKDHSEMPVNHQHSGKNVLLLIMELPRWKCGRSVSYCSQLGLEEALQSNGVETFTITTPWFPRLDELCAGRRFDQIWIDIVHSWQGPKIFDQTNFLEKLVELAPIRLGFLPESLTYDDEEIDLEPGLQERFTQVVNRTKYLTHIAACDEKDAEYFSDVLEVPAIWWPPAVPSRFISQENRFNSEKPATFCGALYGDRKNILTNHQLKMLISHGKHPERGTIYPFVYDLLHFFSFRMNRKRRINVVSIFEYYMNSLGRVRKACFELWLTYLTSGCAVVNLPHNVKTYSGRVVEGMAAGVPVISWEIPARPRNRLLFEEEKEILLFQRDKPETLARQIRRIKEDKYFANKLVNLARSKMINFHSLEKRVQQILDWIECDVIPVYTY